MSIIREVVLQSILTTDLFSCSPHRIIVFPINLKASTCRASRKIQVSINIINLSKVFNIQAFHLVIHSNKEQLQIVILSVWLTAVKIPIFFSGESLNHFNQLDVQKLDVVSFLRQVVNFPKVHWHMIPQAGHDLCRVSGIQTAGLRFGICLSNINSEPNTHISKCLVCNLP